MYIHVACGPSGHGGRTQRAARGCPDSRRGVSGREDRQGSILPTGNRTVRGLELSVSREEGLPGWDPAFSCGFSQAVPIDSAPLSRQALPNGWGGSGLGGLAAMIFRHPSWPLRFKGAIKTLG